MNITESEANNIRFEIERKNRQYKKANKAKRRVMICKDLIERIESDQFKIMGGSFVEFLDFTQHEPLSLQDAILNETLPSCRVCAVGGLFLSTIRFANEATYNGYGFCSYLMDIPQFNTLFSMNQLLLVETCFEGNIGWFKASNSDDYETIIKFGNDNGGKGTRKLLIAILNNIIKHKGTFIPNDTVTLSEKT